MRTSSTLERGPDALTVLPVLQQKTGATTGPVWTELDRLGGTYPVKLSGCPPRRPSSPLSRAAIAVISCG
ncbi:hypothetical protein GCM10009672_25260 [Nesterenkonia lutea]